MPAQSRKHLVLHWTTPKNLLTILLFTTLTIIIEYIVITFAIPTGTKDLTAITLPFLSITISLLYNFLPAAVIITLVASFTLHTKPNIMKKNKG